MTSYGATTRRILLKLTAISVGWQVGMFAWFVVTSWITQFATG